MYNPETYDWYQCDEENYDSGTPPDEQLATAPVQAEEDEQDEVYTLQCRMCGRKITGTHDDLSAEYERQWPPCGDDWGDYRDVTGL